VSRAWTIALALSLSLPGGARADAVTIEIAGRHGERIAEEVRRAVGDALPRGSRVEGRVERAGRRWRARVEARSADGGEIARGTLTARSAAALARLVAVWAAEELAPQPPPAPERVAAAPARAAPPRAARAAPRREPEPVAAAPALPAPLAMRVGFAVVTRSFTYNDDVFGTLAPYELPAAPVVSAGLEWFPGGHADLGLLSGLSVHAEGELGLGIETVAANGTVHPTELWTLGAGVRYRLRVDEVELSVDAGYFGYGFAIRDASEDAPRPAVPGVELHAVRAGAGVRWDIGSGLYFTGSGAYLAPLAVGEIGSEAWFPRLSVGGVEGDVGFGITIDDIAIGARASMRRFFYAMNPDFGDPRVAGGAVDQSFSGALELTYAPR
jgi:hypothetical protein